MSMPLLKTIAQRLALGVMLLLLVSVLIFAGTQLLPGDVAQAILGQSATPEALANLRRDLGLNDPAIVRYWHWVSNALTGDFGKALSNGQDISQALGKRMANTLFLAFWAAVVSVPLNVAAVPPVPTAVVRVRSRSTPRVPTTATAPETTGRQESRLKRDCVVVGTNRSK